MTFLLRVDEHRWRHNVDAVLTGRDDPASGGRVVPVAKSNGYGLGQALVAREMRHRKRPVIAVGTIYEALDVHLEWDADILVLTPWNVAEPQSVTAWRQARHRYGTMLITTIADTASLHAIAEESQGHPARPVRVLLEGLTSVRRFGFIQPELQAALREPLVVDAMSSGALRLAGLALHLPMVAPHLGRTDPNRHLADEAPTEPVIPGSGKVQQAVAWARWWLAEVGRCNAGVPGTESDFSCAADVWVSHLTHDELHEVRAALPDVPVHPRIGTALWLGDPGALEAHGVVLAVHRAHSGGAGYFQRRLPGGSHLAIVGGGTSHGVALSGPIGAATLRRRVTTATNGLLDAVGRVPSPFRWQGKRLWFLEAPHASVSLLVVPKGVRPPQVGEEIPCQVRLTTAHFDHVVGLE